MVNEGQNIYIGKQIKNYTILHKLGDGGFAHVYLAQQDFPRGHLVAIKLLDPKYLKSKTRHFFLHEAQFLSELEHPHILPILDHDESEGTPYIVVEYAPGGTLRERINNLPPITLGEAITILRQVGEAVHTAHQHNIVHCDLKPENILFSENNDAMLADFGIAIRLGAKDEFYGPPRGTYAYMAPEQFDGIFTKEGEQYSLGCIAYELFTGSHPFEYIDPFNPHDREIMKNGHKNAEPLPLRELNADLPEHIEEATVKAMAKKPQERHINVDAFIQSLQRSATHSSKSLLSATNPLRTPPPNDGSYGRLQRPVTDFPGNVLSSPTILEAFCEMVRPKELYSRVFHNPCLHDPPARSHKKNVGNGKPESVNPFAQNIIVPADDISHVSRDITQPEIKDSIDPGLALRDLRLPPIFLELFRPILRRRLGLSLAEGIARDEDAPSSIKRNYTFIKNAAGQFRVLLYIPGWLLVEANQKNIEAFRSVGSAFQKSSTLIIFTDTELYPLDAFQKIMKQWSVTRQIKVIYVPWNHVVTELMKNEKDKEDQEIWFIDKLELQNMIKVAKKPMSLQQMDGNDTESLVKILEKLPELIDEPGRGGRTLLQSAGLGEIVSEFVLTGTARNIAWGLVDQLKRRARLPEHPGYEVLGLLLCYILSLKDFSPKDSESIKQIIRKYAILPPSRPL